MAFDKEKFNEIINTRGVDVLRKDPKGILKECGVEITDKQAEIIKKQIDTATKNAVGSIINVIFGIGFNE